jgi:adenosine deaminase
MDSYHSGVRYLELRFAPQLHAIPGMMSIEEVVCAVNRGLERASRVADELDRVAGDKLDFADSFVEDEEVASVMKELVERGVPHPYHPEAPNHHYGIIVCAMRFFLPTFSPYYEAFWEVHKGEDPHRVFGLASVALVTAVNNLRRKGKCCCHNGDCGQCNDCLFKVESSPVNGYIDGHQNEHEYILPVVAIDIAGAESGYPASDHRVAFDLAHQSFLNKTVHAGEAYGPESIFLAITDLHAERIGHGCHLFRWDMIGAGEGRGGRPKSKEVELTEAQKREYVENLTRYLGTMRICMEVCLSSNLQTMPELNGDVHNHPARKMIEEGLAVTFCTDNMLVSHTSMPKELEMAVNAFELSAGQLRNLVFNGFKRSFMAKRYRTKRDYNRRVISFYKRIEREFGIGDSGRD